MRGFFKIGPAVMVMIASPVALMQLFDVSWVGNNMPIVVGVLSLIGVVITAWVTSHSKREPSIADEMQNFREWYDRVLAANEKLEATNMALGKDSAGLREQNGLLRTQNQKLGEQVVQLQEENKTLKEEAVVREKEIKDLQKDVLRLNRRVSELEKGA